MGREAERELGVAGDPNADLNAPRSQPYPLPPIPLSYADQRTAAALKGAPHSIQPTPQARNSERYDNRPACCGSASCIPICPVQAKYHATSHVAKAEGAGAQVVPEAIVSRVEWETTAASARSWSHVRTAARIAPSARCS